MTQPGMRIRAHKRRKLWEVIYIVLKGESELMGLMVPKMGRMEESDLPTGPSTVFSPIQTHLPSS